MNLGHDTEGAIKAGWTAISDEASTYGITEEQFRDWLFGWSVQSLEQDGNTVGIWATRGPRCHVAVLPSARGHWSRRLLREMIAPLFAEYGRLETKATTDHGREFVQRIGFVNEGQDYVLRRQI